MIVPFHQYHFNSGWLKGLPFSFSFHISTDLINELRNEIVMLKQAIPKYSCSEAKQLGGYCVNYCLGGDKLKCRPRHLVIRLDELI